MTLWTAHDHRTHEILQSSSLHELMENVKTLCLYSTCCISDFTFRSVLVSYNDKP